MKTFNEFNEGFLFGKEKDKDIKTIITNIKNNIDGVIIDIYGKFKITCLIPKFKEEENKEIEDNNGEYFENKKITIRDYSQNNKHLDRKTSEMGIKKNTDGKYYTEVENPKYNKYYDYKRYDKVEIVVNAIKGRRYTGTKTSDRMVTYTISVNGVQFLDRKGESLVSYNLSKKLWDLLTDIHKLRLEVKRGLISKDKLDKALNKLKK